MNKSHIAASIAPELLPDEHRRGKPSRSIWRQLMDARGKIKLRYYLYGLALLAIIAVLGTLLASRHFDWAALSRTITGFNSGLVLLLMALLPLVGFPISVVYLVAGAKFGPIGGLPVVAGVTAFHLLATYWITRSFLRAPIQRLLVRRGHHLPHILPGEYAGVCVLAALIPGPPYFVRNYLLALTDVPLRIYFWVCLGVYVAHSYVSILLGDLTSDPDGSQLLVLIGMYGLKLILCAYVVWKLRRHRQKIPTQLGHGKPAA